MGRHDRPEHSAPPEIFYNEDEARKYTDNTRMIAIQTALTERALELLALPQDGSPKLLLDLGCGSGLSGEALTENGHVWVGFDISPAMLDVARERDVEGDVAQLDLGHGLPIRPGSFDGAISISALQWLCNADNSRHDPRKRLKRFFETLYSSLSKGARAVLQIYPENVEQASMLTSSAMKVGFSGGLVVDYPHSTRAKKFFLVLMWCPGRRPSKAAPCKVQVGGGGMLPHARGMDGGDPGGSDEEWEGEGQVKVAGRRTQKRRKTGKEAGRRDWIVKKKQQQRSRGYTSIKPDTKYTGRKRKDRL